jgi:hypothetical protein
MNKDRFGTAGSRPFLCQWLGLLLFLWDPLVSTQHVNIDCSGHDLVLLLVTPDSRHDLLTKILSDGHGFAHALDDRLWRRRLDRSSCVVAARPEHRACQAIGYRHRAGEARGGGVVLVSARQEGPRLRGCSAGNKATVMASSPDTVAARPLVTASRGMGGPARRRAEPRTPPSGSAGGGRCFIYRPPLGSLASVRSATGGGNGPDRHLTWLFSGSGDRAARGTVAAALASELAVVGSGVAVGRQAAAGTRAGGSVRERAPPGFQEKMPGCRTSSTGL